jgi:GNAT superfamily N-acetyltransferase
MLIETERLQIRRLGPGDEPFILELLNEPAFLQNIGDRGVRDLAGASAYIRNGPVASYERHGFGLYWAGLREGDIPAGICGLLKRDYLDDVDIGFAFLERYRGKGYGFEAASAVLEYGWRTLGLNRIVAITAPHNEASMGLLRKLGMRAEGTIQGPGADGESRLFGCERSNVDIDARFGR